MTRLPSVRMITCHKHVTLLSGLGVVVRNMNDIMLACNGVVQLWLSNAVGDVSLLPTDAPSLSPHSLPSRLHPFRPLVFDLAPQCS